MASYVIKGHPPEARQRLAALPMESIVVSVVTQAELLYGLARKGHPAAFARLIHEFLLRVEVCCLGMERLQPFTAIFDHPAPRPASLLALSI